MTLFYTIGKTFRRADLRKIFYMFYWKLAQKVPPARFDDAHPCVFALSTGRVGSETLTHLLKLSKNALVYHEPWPELFGLSKKAYEFSDAVRRDDRLEAVLEEGFLTARRELLKDALYCNRGYIEAGPPATFLAPMIKKAIPEAKFIHLVRSPAAVVRSAMLRGWYAGHAYDASRITPLPDTEFGRLWDGLDPFQKNCWLWAETNRWIRNFCATLPTEKNLLVHAEDIFSGNPELIHTLFEFLHSNAPSTPAVMRVVRQKFNAAPRRGDGQAPKWKTALQEPLLSFVGQTAGELGYDLRGLLSE